MKHNHTFSQKKKTTKTAEREGRTRVWQDWEKIEKERGKQYSGHHKVGGSEPSAAYVTS